MNRMRIVFGVLVAVFGLTLPVLAQDASQAVEGGGISVAGWMGMVDASEASAGQVLENAKFSSHGDMLHAKTGPAVSYWHKDHMASGNFSVKATFEEPSFMALNDHPHPYGVFIGGSDMGTDQQRYLYCAAYGSGTFIVRGFGPAPFQMNGRRPQPHDAVHKAEQGQPVKQEIALNVHGGNVECAINGTVVATFPVSDVVGEGKLKSTDGVYGLRFGHNTEAAVSGLTMMKH